MHTNRRDILRALGVAGIGVTFAPMLNGCSRDDGPYVNFLSWDSYTGENTLADFEEATGTAVRLSLIANNDELFAKLREGNQGYDVVVPGSDTVERMVQADMLMPIDHSLVPNFRNVTPESADVPFDPGRKYSMPYMWYLPGIGYRKSKVNGVPDSWKWVIDSDLYKGRIGLMGEATAMFQIAFKYLGLSANTTDPAAIQRVEQMLTRQKPNITLFHDDNGQDRLLAGEIDLVIEYNGDIAQIMREDPDIGFVVPNEGSVIGADSLCIPKGAHAPDLAHKFINYLLDAKVSAAISDTIRYPSDNAAAIALMPAEFRNNPVILPPRDRMATSEYAKFQGPDFVRKLEEAFTRIRAS
jgi:spermidine/putrescine transport system substrate-binding protein